MNVLSSIQNPTEVLNVLYSNGAVLVEYTFLCCFFTLRPNLTYCLRSIVDIAESLTFNLGVTFLVKHLPTPESDRKKGNSSNPIKRQRDNSVCGKAIGT